MTCAACHKQLHPDEAHVFEAYRLRKRIVFCRHCCSRCDTHPTPRR